jgi:hypothetical protein
VFIYALNGNVCKPRSMERSCVKSFHGTHVFDLTNLKGEKRRNVRNLKLTWDRQKKYVLGEFLLYYTP